jgi:hypothetical protein
MLGSAHACSSNWPAGRSGSNPSGAPHVFEPRPRHRLLGMSGDVLGGPLGGLVHLRYTAGQPCPYCGLQASSRRHCRSRLLCRLERADRAAVVPPPIFLNRLCWMLWSNATVSWRAPQEQTLSPAQRSRCRAKHAPCCPASIPCRQAGEVGWARCRAKRVSAVAVGWSGGWRKEGACPKASPPSPTQLASGSGCSLHGVAALAGHALHPLVGALVVGAILSNSRVWPFRAPGCDSLRALG